MSKKRKRARKGAPCEAVGGQCAGGEQGVRIHEERENAGENKQVSRKKMESDDARYVRGSNQSYPIPKTALPMIGAIQWTCG